RHCRPEAGRRTRRRPGSAARLPCGPNLPVQCRCAATVAAMSSSEVLSIERNGHVGTLWLDRAERRNAMGPDFWKDLPVMMEQLADDEEIRAVVVAARGPHFSVGLDLKAMGGSVAGSGGSQVTNARQTLKQVHRMQASITAVAECPKPVIA